MSKLDWWPKNPYPEDIFPMSIEEYIKAIPDGNLRAAVSGYLARWAWDVASGMIWDAWQEEKSDED